MRDSLGSVTIPVNTREELWTQYQATPMPPHIGDTIDGVRLGDVDDEVQDVLSSWSVGPKMPLSKVASLGRAAADLERVLPKINDHQTQRYFSLVRALARSALDSIAAGELDAEK